MDSEIYEVEPIGMDNATMMLGLLGNDSKPGQDIREYSKNGFEAIEKIGGTGRVLWTHDRFYEEKTGIKKKRVSALWKH